MNVTLDHIEDVAHNIKTFWFKPDKKPRYTAGQFTEMYLPHDHPDDRGIRRWFTLSSSPSEELLSITTKLATGQVSTFKQQLFSLKPGTQLHLPMVFVAGGIGVTPMRSMVKWLLDNKDRRAIQLIYAVTEHDELAFQPLFDDYGLEFTPIVKNPGANYKGEAGSLDAQRILDLTDHDDNTLFYLSGPEPMVEAFDKDLKAKGINKHKLVGDFFPGYQKF
jgi:ferredoxin-NADP reductase